MTTFKIGRTTGGLLKIGYGTGSTVKIVSSSGGGAFSPQAVLLTSGTSYSIPAGATTMKAWIVGGGGSTSIAWAGGCAYKTWSVSGASISYALGVGCTEPLYGSATSSTATYSSITITGEHGSGVTAGGYSGGDGGANGGYGTAGNSGAVGGNSATLSACGRRPATDISGLFAALTLAGVSTTETCGATAAFGSSAYVNKYNSALNKTAGYGGRGGYDYYFTPGGNGALVLYFT
jgi:hypothetical protein